MLNNPPPNYKDHLRPTIMTSPVDYEDEEMDSNQAASPETSILSSIHSSGFRRPIDAGDGAGYGNDTASSFLSVTPSMLDSSILEDQGGQVLSCSVSSEDENYSSDDEDEEQSGNYLREEEDPCSWYERSTFESVGSQLLDLGENATSPFSSQKDRNRRSIETKREAGDAEDQHTNNNRQSKEDEGGEEATTMGSILQAGTIVLGAASMILMLAHGADKKQKNDKSQSKKSKCRGTNSATTNRDDNKENDHRMSWLLRDW